MIRKTPETVRLNADEIERAAIAWVTRSDAAALTDSEQAAFDAWLNADVRHHGAYVRASSAFAMFDRDEDSYAPATPLRAPLMNRRTFWAGGAAAVAASAAGIVWYTGKDRIETIFTRESETRHVILSGGANLLLDARSRIGLHRRRGVEWVKLEVGRAWFDSSPSDVPLNVEAGELQLNTSKASFSASRNAETVDLLVSRGSVRAWNARAPELSDHVLRTGTKATLIKASLVEEAQLSPAEIDRAEAWTSGHLVLAGESVDEAAAMFNRFNRQQLLIQSDALKQRPIVGYFELNDPATFAAGLKATYNVSVRRRGDFIVVE